MAFWKKKAKKSVDVVSPKIEKPETKNKKTRKVLPVEVRVLGAKARDLGLGAAEIAEITGAKASTVEKWARIYREGGIEAFMQASNPGSRRVCSELEKRIEDYRKENPEAGVRRIRDELRRNECLEVSAEKVRQVVNDAGLGNPPSASKPKPQQPRRFEREIPNALWQIDIFTFELKRMYRVYLVGIIDDHSRYIVGHGLFRQQTADAVLEVVKGAIGQWGAPREILSDNGRQFVAWRGKSQFQKVMKQQGINHVRSAPHHPMTLGKIERFWKTIWTEFLDDAVFASFADARQRVEFWVNFYNHQRPHQGIDGACPADRFYGIANDVEEALKQGCHENALRMALGQETRPPLYLLGKLGETDVRVTRKGETIEVKLGDSVQEVIQLGTPFSVDSEGNYKRGEAHDEMAGDDWGGEIPGDRAGNDRTNANEGALPVVWSESSDAESGNGENETGLDGSAFSEETGEEREERGAAEDYDALEANILLEERCGALEDPV